MTQPKSGRRLLRNMRLAKGHADALESYDQRPPEYIFTTVERKVLREAIRFLREMAGVPQSSTNGESVMPEGDK